MKRKVLVFVIFVFILVSGHVKAEEEKDAVPKYDLGNIIVSATKTETYQGEVGSSTTVITAEEIKKSQKQTVNEVLRDVPGVTVMQTSAFGGTTSAYLRGAKPGQTLVLIDGVEVNDPMSTDRSFDFAHLTTDNIERIEIVRGPQSTLYGSDAMSGVINIITKKGEGKPKLDGYFEGGSYNTFRENLGLSGGMGNFNYSLSASRLDSDGINKASTGSEKDGYGNTVISSKLGYKLFNNSELSVVTRFTDAKTSIDDGSDDDDPNHVAWWTDFNTKAAFDQSINSWWSHNLSLSYHDVHRYYRDEADDAHTTENEDSWYKGNNTKFEWQHNFSPVGWSIITSGFEYEEEEGSSYYRSGTYISKIGKNSVNNTACYLQDQLKFWDRLFIALGIRVDDHEIFGVESTYKISAAYFMPQTGTRLKANWGTGFKAPSIYQLYSNYGDPNLKPDESRSYDFGFEQSFLKDKLSFDLTYFHNDFENMVDWDSLTWKYKNIGKAVTKGFEFGTKIKPMDNLTIKASYTYTDTEDKDTGLELLRRPKVQANLSVDWKFIEKANLNLGMTYVGDRKDVIYDASWTQVRITDKAYTTARVALSYDVTKNFQLFARAENLLDEKYEDVHGYAMPGLSFYGGIKASF
ncbi:MAG TPA: TonB-dependent receptor [Smithellaceae bacterium]|nr:TonB-dependent receptor [Smithellaceae bacterium]